MENPASKKSQTDTHQHVGFTKGPWELWNWKIIAVFNGTQKGDREEIGIAAIHDNIIGTSQAEANARLIASAPDLLAERDRLREEKAELIKACEVTPEFTNPGKDFVSVPRFWWEKLQQVAKASAQEKA